MSDEITVPNHWEKHVLAAYLLMMGDSWKTVSARIGRCEKTIALWKHHPSWAQAKAEAEQRWLYDVKDQARQAVTQQLKEGDGDLGLKVLERLDPHFTPKSKSEADVTHHLVAQLNQLDTLPDVEMHAMVLRLRQRSTGPVIEGTSQPVRPEGDPHGD